jgi:hypothetical protein
MREAVQGGPGVPRDFDIDAFNAAQVQALAGYTPAQLLEAFRDVRKQTCDFVATLLPEDLDRIGYHPWFGDESLYFLLKLIYRHPMLHLRDIRLAMETGAAVPHGEGYASMAGSDRAAPRISARKQAIADHMRQGHADTWPVLSTLKAADLPLRVFGDGEAIWSVGDLVGHLADAEAGLLGQVRRLLAGKPTVPDDFDLDRWNRSAVRRSRARTFSDLLDLLLKAHQEALATLEATDDSLLDRVGRHGSGEVLSVEGFFRRMADHRRDHTEHIRRALQGREVPG